MKRRELLQMIASMTGMAMVGMPALVSGYGHLSLPDANNDFSATDIAKLDEIAESILPRTDTPGAKDAAVGLLMAQFVTDCYTAQDQAEFRAGLADIETRAGDFMAMTPAARSELLTALDIEAKAHDAATGTSGQTPRRAHYFTMMKQLVIFGFFTSKVGATEVLRHVAVPGHYDGDIAYVPGTPAWYSDGGMHWSWPKWPNA